MIGQRAPVDPGIEYAQRIADLESSIAELKRLMSRPAQVMLDSNPSWTPTLTDLSPGTGGAASLTASWRWIGGPNVGDLGRLSIRVLIAFGTTGRTFPTSTTRITLPSGFAINPSLDVSADSFGDVEFLDTGVAGYIGKCGATSTTQVKVFYLNDANALGNPTASLPFVWDSGDYLSVRFLIDAIRT